jgi:hypothetical protein
MNMPSSNNIPECDCHCDCPEYEDNPNQIVLRGKWLIENCSTLDEAIECLYAEIEHYRQLQRDGWELIGPVEDDYGLLEKRELPTTEDLIMNS